MTGYEFTGYILGSGLFDRPKPHFCITNDGNVYTELVSNSVDHTRVCLITCGYLNRHHQSRRDISIKIEYRIFNPALGNEVGAVHMMLSELTLPILIRYLDKAFAYAHDIMKSNVANKRQWSEYLDSYKKWCKESIRIYNLEQITN